MRKKKNLVSRLEAVSDYLYISRSEDRNFNTAVNDKDYIDFDAWFGDTRPLYLEIGCGKGKFIRECALRDAEIPHLAVEHYGNVAILAAEAAEREGVKNLRFSISDIVKLDGEIEEGSVKRIYLNFSDPWPKKRHANRRLTHPDFLRLYKKWLSDDGEIFFKTDNDKLFEFSLNSFCSEDFILSNITFDLHNSDFEGNIMTEYETRFSEEGKNIFRLEARKRL